MFVKLVVDRDSGKLQTEAPDPVEFKSVLPAGAKEADLEELIRQDASLLFPVSGDEDDSPTLLVIGQQAVTASGKRSDLVALDHTGALVLVEIKRDAADMKARKEPFEFQAVRYAAGLATLEGLDSVVRTLFGPYLAKHSGERRPDETSLQPEEVARRRLKSFMEDNGIPDDRLNHAQEIVLVAASYDPDALSAVAWMSRALPIRALQFQPQVIGQDTFLEIQQVVPPPELETFFVGLRDRPNSTPSRSKLGSAGETSRTYRPRMNRLVAEGLVKPGDVLSVKKKSDSEAEVVDANTVLYRGRKTRPLAWAKEITGWSAVNIYEWVIHKPTGKLLDELRSEIEAQDAAAEASEDQTTDSSAPLSPPSLALPIAPTPQRAEPGPRST